MYNFNAISLKVLYTYSLLFMKLLYFLFILLFSLNLKGQCPPPGLDHILSSQERIDAFIEVYGNCNVIKNLTHLSMLY